MVTLLIDNVVVCYRSFSRNPRPLIFALTTFQYIFWYYNWRKFNEYRFY